MNEDAKKLLKTIEGQAESFDDSFLDLARNLRRLQETDSEAFRIAQRMPGLGRRRAYYLVSISRAFDGLPVSDARLAAIGWTKLLTLAPRVSADNLGELLELAESCTVFELEKLAKDLPGRQERCVLLRFSDADYPLFLEAMVAYGAQPSGRGLAGKEQALPALLRAALAARRG